MWYVAGYETQHVYRDSPTSARGPFLAFLGTLAIVTTKGAGTG